MSSEKTSPKNLSGLEKDSEGRIKSVRGIGVLRYSRKMLWALKKTHNYLYALMYDL